MTDDAKTPNLCHLIRDRIYCRFGVKGLVALAIISVVSYTCANWDTVRRWPGVSFVASYLTRWPVPHADPNRFSVLLAHLQNDPNGDHERLIVEALKEFEGIQVLVLDRTIALEGPVPEKQEEQGHETAREYLRESGASVAIWGTVLRHRDESLCKLYWTASQGDQYAPKRYDAPSLASQYRLPEVFWSDLAEILRMLVASRYSEFSAEKGHYVADRLPPFIARVRTLLEASDDRPGWDANSRGATRVILGNALSVFGQQSGKREPVEEAIIVYREALKEHTRDRVPLDWATTQNNLGVALRSLGAHEPGTARLEEAVAAYREALKERKKDRVPLDWAMTQNNLGNALCSLGTRESGTARLEEAVAAYREALKERKKDRVPVQWATTQSNLGVALCLLGERESGTARLEEAVVAYKKALRIFESWQITYHAQLTKTNLHRAEALLNERMANK